jgi:cysteine desulfuration protein SufE
MPLPAFADIESNLSFLDEWEDRYRYLIELGRMLPPFPAQAQTEINKVRGCASQVWVTVSPHGKGPDAKLDLAGDSDAHIVKGLVALALALYQDKSAAEIAAIDAFSVFEGFGLKDHLSSQRSNGFRSLIDRIRTEAEHIVLDGANPTSGQRSLN